VTVEPPDTTRPRTGDEGGGDVEGLVEGMVEGAEQVIGDVEEVAEETFETLRQDLLGRDGYLSVLLMTIVTMVAVPLGQVFRGGSVLISFCIALLVLTVMTRAKVRRVLRNLAVVATVPVVLVALFADVTGETFNAGHRTGMQAAFIVLYTAVLAMCFPVILQRAFSHKRVTLNTVAAALAAWLLIGLIFTGCYRFVDIVANPMFSQPNTNGFTNEYFSYITLSTVGYGDFTPNNDGGRTLAMLEALFGQAFLVTIVAMVVANLGREHVQLRRRRGEPHDDEEPTGPGPAPSRDL
jgi:hypothetical protein